MLKGAGYKTMDTALKRNDTELRRTGRIALSFVCYSVHDVANPETQTQPGRRHRRRCLGAGRGGYEARQAVNHQRLGRSTKIPRTGLKGTRRKVPQLAEVMVACC